MNRIIFFCASVAVLAVSGAAIADSVVLIGHHQRSGAGILSKLISNGANGNPASTAVWDWSPSTSVLSMTGRYWATAHVHSNPLGPSIAGVEVYDLAIDLSFPVTYAASFTCHEGTFLPVVGANGCLNTMLGDNLIDESSALYNVGGNANCIQRTIGGDDVSLGNPVGLMTVTPDGGCDGVNGVGDLWVIVPDSRFLIFANTPNIKGSDDCYLFGPNDSAPSSPCVVDPTIAGAQYMVFAPNVNSDADTIIDALDNCTAVANTSQCDSDADGYGNHCDGDMNNNATTNAQDYVLFRQQLGQPSTGPTYNEADINCNGTVNAQDYVLFRGLLGSSPGPSGLVP